jgi:hypothetical protein
MRIKLALSLNLFFSALVAAQTPLGTSFTYQGRLQTSGAPANGPHDLLFSLYPTATGGFPAAGPVCFDNVDVSGGLFTVTLDFGSAVFNGDARWLEIQVRADEGENCESGSYTVLTPRQQLTAAPNALFALNGSQLDSQPSAFYRNASNIINGTLADARLSSNVALLDLEQNFTDEKHFAVAPSFDAAGLPFLVESNGLVTNLNADLLDGLNASAFLQSIPVPLALSGTNGGGVIKGTNAGTVTAVMGVQGEATSTAATGSSYGGFFTAVDDIGIGTYGRASGVNGKGVYGDATHNSGVNYGVYGVSDSTSGRGVYGEATATSGMTYGVYGVSESPDGTGVVGQSTASSGGAYGVLGTCQSPSGRAVFGVAAGSTGTNTGVFGQTASGSGRGVYGENLSSTGNAYGVYGKSTSTSARAVFGEATAGSGISYGGYFRSDSVVGTGVAGITTVVGANDSPYGVFGSAALTTMGYGVFALGDIGATGVKSFRIDHPADPENKYLLHYAVESPEVLNAYSGQVRLDGQGEAVVELPAYFASVNKDPRYLLTAVGAPMPMLHVAAAISAEALQAGEQAVPGVAAPTCFFRIAGGAPGAKVSWEVTALRNDLRVRLHGAPVEREKFGSERGKYQHPELYGEPPERGIAFQPADERIPQSPRR